MLVFALVMASVSPACAFISGKDTSIIEVCSEFGSKSIVVDENGQPVQNEHQKQAQSSDCAFCFAQAHGKVISSDYPSILYQAVIREGAESSFTVNDRDIRAHIYIARAPPSYIA